MSDAAELCGELSEADLRGCRWIEGPATPLRPGMFCCATPAEPGGSSCAKHRKIVWAYRRARLPSLCARRPGWVSS